MANQKRKKTAKKAPLMYAITAEFEREIRSYVDDVHTKTGLPKTRIVSNFLIEGVRAAKKFCPELSENSENVAAAAN